MKRLLIILLLTGCGSIPCEEGYTLFVKGLCVNAGGYQVDTQNLEITLILTEAYFNQFFPDNRVDLESLLLEYKVTLKYSDHLCRARGVTFHPFVDHADRTEYASRIFVLGWSCWNRNYVMAHEILHIISYHHLKVSGEMNMTHMVPNVFLIWADKLDIPREETVEYHILTDVKEMCGVTE